ncbi:zinc finger protein 474-like isoform X2 [Hydractinia symbiolongicarpus]|nr:zinc finger protein 474-like isoform X2 [Hydractinia symbiolongicarpus]XP_057299952.1 zinc finger protein 474-like isoform X2 [Hydractinia symbiolongicarpus]XP_057299962.1 zinc finger protein 474-like isoform X2 [Hydractinia symbiolongicarpus]
MASPAKASTCFICGNEFPHAELSAHEKSCLENIQKTDIQYTRQNTESSETSLPHTFDSSNLSNHSASSSDSYEKKFVRCYICGTDVPTYLTAIHEKNCKKSWETGLFNSICASTKKSTSLSRGTSRTDLRHDSSTSGMKKSKSSSNIAKSPTTDKVFFDDDITSPKPKGMSSLKSKSFSNLSKTKPKEKKPFVTGVRNTDWNKTKSLQDIRSDRPAQKKSGPGQYVLCNFCGKLYSMHSIGIHERQCEKTRSLQKNAGTGSDYKIKSKSMVDLSGIKKGAPLTRPLTRNTTRPSTATSTRKTEHKNSPKQRPSTSHPLTRVTRIIGVSTNTGNKTRSPDKSESKTTSLKNVNVKPTEESGEQHKDVQKKISKNSEDLKISNGIKQEEKKTASPGLQKCYLCGQLYGTRSLPIHEKQCLKKWEREKKGEKVKEMNSKKQKEIKVIPFGRSKSSQHSQETSPETSLCPDDQAIFTPTTILESQVVVESKASSATNETLTEQPVDEQKEIVINGTHNSEISLNESNISSDDVDDFVQPLNSPNKFVICVYCGRNYGQHSIHIHEKSCRDRKLLEEEAQNRIEAKLKAYKKLSALKSSKSLGDITSDNLSYLNGNVANGDAVDLVKCDECNRNFLSVDIEKHRVSCSVFVF